MVLWVNQYDIRPDKLEAYVKWSESAIKRILALPGVVEFRGYRGSAGASEAVTTTEFTDMAAWAAAYSSEDVQKLLLELRTFVENVSFQLWGPSPVVPKPLRPKK